MPVICWEVRRLQAAEPPMTSALRSRICFKVGSCGSSVLPAAGLWVETVEAVFCASSDPQTKDVAATAKRAALMRYRRDIRCLFQAAYRDAQARTKSMESPVGRVKSTRVLPWLKTKLAGGTARKSRWDRGKGPAAKLA